LAGLLVTAAALAVSSGYSQDKKDPQPKGKVSLPANWKKLGLNDDQKTKIYAVRGTYQGKIDALKEQIEQLKKEENSELLKVLTDDQKTLLKKILTEKATDPTKDDKKGDKKGEDKKGEVIREEETLVQAFRRQD
jgi:hypothetical protein